MKKLLFLFFPALLASCMAKESNTENPRGVYRLTRIVGKMGEIVSPYDQYKICTDSITLRVLVSNERINIDMPDGNRVFDYTGSEPKNPDDKSMLIYDSNAKGFLQKWWSENDNHIYFPKSDWCIEKYEADLYSAIAKPYFNILMNAPKKEEGCTSYVGIWREILGIPADEIMEILTKYDVTLEEYLAELKNDKNKIDNFIEETKRETSRPLILSVYTSSNMMFYFASSFPGHGYGRLTQIPQDIPDCFPIDGVLCHATWLSENCIALTSSEGVPSLYLLYREAENATPISLIADHYITE